MLFFEMSDFDMFDYFEMPDFRFIHNTPVLGIANNKQSDHIIISNTQYNLYTINLSYQFYIYDS